jgi:hypothetical protein
VAANFFRPRLEARTWLRILPVVLLFKRLFDFPRATFARLRNKRRTERHPVAAGFPLKAVVSLLGTDDPAARKRAVAGSGRDWGGIVADLSGEGLSLRLPPAATTGRGEKSVLVLALDDFELRIPCTVSHFRVRSAESLAGLSLQFENDTQRKGYLQLLEAVVLGSGFAFDKSPKDPSGLHCDRYRSGGKRAVLTVWREGDESGRLYGFELTVGDHCVRGDLSRSTLQACASDEARTALPAGPLNREIIRLYRIIAANLPRELPADLRQQMQSIARPPAMGTRR